MMNKFFNTRHSVLTDAALLILRLAVGTWMLSKGLPKVEMLFSGSAAFPAVLGMSSQVSLALTVFAQVVCSALLLIGVTTRFAAFVLAINMFVAVVVAHSNDPFEKAEPALHFLLVYLVLLLAGAGKFSVDYLIQSRQPTS